MLKDLGNTDIALVIDSTGSMGHLIASAKQNIHKILIASSKKFKELDLDFRIAGISYRDHPPEDSTYVVVHQDFDGKANKKFYEFLESLQADGGGDTAEAVFDGLQKLTELKWRDNSYKIAILVGDAPPHGMEGKDCCD